MEKEERIQQNQHSADTTTLASHKKSRIRRILHFDVGFVWFNINKHRTMIQSDGSIRSLFIFWISDLIHANQPFGCVRSERRHNNNNSITTDWVHWLIVLTPIQFACFRGFFEIQYKSQINRFQFIGAWACDHTRPSDTHTHERVKLVWVIFFRCKVQVAPNTWPTGIQVSTIRNHLNENACHCISSVIAKCRSRRRRRLHRLRCCPRKWPFSILHQWHTYVCDTRVCAFTRQRRGSGRNSRYNLFVYSYTLRSPIWPWLCPYL